jgi:YD repeat-containing protein
VSIGTDKGAGLLSPIFGNRFQAINELGHAWTTTYDVFNRRITETDPLNRTTTYGYGIGVGGCSSCHSEPKVTEIISPSGKVTRITYNAEWQKLSETTGFGTPEAATISYTYNTVGNLVSTTDPRGKVWTFTYDNRNRRITATDPLGHITRWTYDAAGNRLSETRPDGGVTTNTYDVMNRLLTTRNPNNETTTFAYGGTGAAGNQGDNLITLTDARGNSHAFTYDLMHRKTAMIYPGGSQETWTYDAVGNNLTYTTRAGQVRTCTIDDRNRDIHCDWSDSTPDITKTYDAAGRVLTLSTQHSTLIYTYNAANELLSETQDLQAPVNLPPRTVAGLGGK